MPSITIKDLSANILKSLTERAEANQRSVQGELRHLLEREYIDGGEDVIRNMIDGPSKAIYHDISRNQLLLIHTRAGCVGGGDFETARWLVRRAIELERQVNHEHGNGQYIRVRGLWLDPKHGHANAFVDLIHHHKAQPAFSDSDLEELFSGHDDGIGVECTGAKVISQDIGRDGFYPVDQQYYEWVKERIFW